MISENTYSELTETEHEVQRNTNGFGKKNTKCQYLKRINTTRIIIKNASTE